MTSANVAIDNNEIMARNNGATSPLSLNFEGGDVIIGQSTTGSRVGIGTSSPSANIHIVYPTGTTDHGMILDNTSSSGVDWKLYAASTDELWLQNDDVTVGTFDGTNGVYTHIAPRNLENGQIGSMGNVLEKIMRLNPALYNFKTNASGKDKSIGMIANEVQKIFPEVVYEHKGKNDGADDFLTMDNSAFGIISIKAIQEQQQKITTLEERIAKLEAALVNVTSNSKDNAVIKEFPGAKLEQNTPNPFSQVTTIRYKIPAGSNSQISVYDQSGTLVKTFKATESGILQIKAYELSTGTYTYSLLVNGKLIESKKMVIAK